MKTLMSELCNKHSTLAIGGVPSPLDSFEVAESSVLRTNFCIEKPAHRQSAKRYRSVYKDSQPHIQAHLVLPTHKADTKTKRA
jgi:hypothetical protein